MEIKQNKYYKLYKPLFSHNNFIIRLSDNETMKTLTDDNEALCLFETHYEPPISDEFAAVKLEGVREGYEINQWGVILGLRGRKIAAKHTEQGGCINFQLIPHPNEKRAAKGFKISEVIKSTFGVTAGDRYLNWEETHRGVMSKERVKKATGEIARRRPFPNEITLKTDRSKS